MISTLGADVGLVRVVAVMVAVVVATESTMILYSLVEILESIPDVVEEILIGGISGHRTISPARSGTGG